MLNRVDHDGFSAFLVLPNLGGTAKPQKPRDVVVPAQPHACRPPLSLFSYEERGLPTPSSSGTGTPSSQRSVRSASPVRPPCLSRHSRLTHAMHKHDWELLHDVVRELATDGKTAAWNRLPRPLAKPEEHVAQQLEKLMDISPLSPATFECWLSLCNFERNAEALLALVKLL